ncbi:hypothetical protein KIPB_009619, partial [Kipferlia bialata]
VGAVWIAHRILGDGAAPGDAVQEGLAIGLRTREYLKKTQSYVQRRQAEAAMVDL